MSNGLAITGVMTVHNINKIKYPWKYSALSILPVLDQLIIMDAGPHDDDTTQALSHFAMSQDKVVCVPCQWPTNHKGISELTNMGVRRAAPGWILQVQADEIFDESNYGEIMNLRSQPAYYQAVKFNYRHYIGDFHHVFPFVYQSVVRGVRKLPTRQPSYRFVGDSAEAIGIGPVIESSILVHHVGKVHLGRAEAGAFTEFTFQNDLYAGVGPEFAFDKPDPLVVDAYQKGEIDYFRVFASTVAEGKVSAYDGPWPEQLKAWARECGVDLT